MSESGYLYRFRARFRDVRKAALTGPNGALRRWPGGGPKRSSDFTLTADQFASQKVKNLMVDRKW